MYELVTLEDLEKLNEQIMWSTDYFTKDELREYDRWLQDKDMP